MVPSPSFSAASANRVSGSVKRSDIRWTRASVIAAMSSATTTTPPSSCRLRSTAVCASQLSTAAGRWVTTHTPSTESGIRTTSIAAMTAYAVVRTSWRRIRAQSSGRSNRKPTPRTVEM